MTSESSAAIPIPPSAKAPAVKPHPQHFWLWVMCLTGVDYFSTLGYQPYLAFENAGVLAPLATVVLVLVTLFGALPVYSYVASKSHHGAGSIGMLARLVSGWGGKILILVLLGFAATDFVITKTLSAADAAEHLIANPNWPLGESRAEAILVTMLLLMLLGAVFMRGFKEVIGIAVVIVAVYLILNLMILIAGFIHLGEHPEKVELWWERVTTGQWYIEHRPIAGHDWGSILLLCLLLFPKLALGLSGFETGVAVMPLIKGSAGDDPENPLGRIRHTRKLLATAALIMSFFLLGSSVIVSTVIDPSSMVTVDGSGTPIPGIEKKPPAADRALAYIAHGQDGAPIAPFMGEAFGTIYDLVTVMILWFAGASAMAGLLNLVPQYLPKYGMAPEWTRAIRPLVLLFTGINLLVTYLFEADVKKQGDAYATGVLVLMTSAGIAVVIDKYRHGTGPWRKRVPWGFALITLVFIYTTVAVVWTKTVGLEIAACFIVTILVTSFVSRILRSRELRFDGFHIADAESGLYWGAIKDFEITVLVPHRPGRRSLATKEVIIRREHRIPKDVMLIFVEVELTDASDFLQQPWLRITLQEGRFIMKISHAASIAHTLAALALEIGKVGHPPEIHFGWTDETPWTGTLGFLLFGEGNVPWMVRELMRKAEPDPDRRPLIILAGQ